MTLLTILEKYSKNSNKIVSVSTFNTPVGKMYGAADDNFIYVVTFEDSKIFEKSFHTISEKLSCGFMENKNKVLTQLEDELADYFAGNLKSFTVPIKTFGSDFQEDVWLKLQDLPYSSTNTYGDLAKALGRPASHARAVGSACGANSHLIIIPCHRLVSTTSGGGFNSCIDRKKWLLDHEKKYKDK